MNKKRIERIKKISSILKVSIEDRGYKTKDELERMISSKEIQNIEIWSVEKQEWVTIDEHEDFEVSIQDIAVPYLEAQMEINPVLSILVSILNTKSSDELYNLLIKDPKFLSDITAITATLLAPIGIAVSGAELGSAINSGDALDIFIAAIGMTLRVFKIKIKAVKTKMEKLPKASQTPEKRKQFLLEEFVDIPKNISNNEVELLIELTPEVNLSEEWKVNLSEKWK